MLIDASIAISIQMIIRIARRVMGLFMICVSGFASHVRIARRVYPAPAALRHIFLAAVMLIGGDVLFRVDLRCDFGDRCCPMAGHSHFANIQRRKEYVDKKRAKIWSKIAKKLMVAAKRGADPAANLALRYVIDEAKSANMPKDTIQKAIDKGSGAAGTDNFESITYEAYGPSGVAMIIEALSDNRTRTAGDLRLMLDRAGGNLAQSGAVSFVFTKRGIITISADQSTEDRLMTLALDAGADDVLSSPEGFQILTHPADFLRVKEAIESASIAMLDAQITYLPSTSVSLDAETLPRFNKLLDALDDNDDVQNIHHNAIL